ncbi:hypothetical protein BC936DRAFT_141164 [Jimgerdemannia flammicorona]|uniref:Uncharacterized protein n=1 Tax=Jimgerdemannia flammicorona TaxID=994334 RepID=A0A433DG98_9FUNG|nr:hypothetical protein BC936DRAFT_141164 [Jimgerdemannia flammicorona]
MSNNYIRWLGISVLARNLRSMIKLSELNLSGNSIDNYGAISLAEGFAYDCNLATLELSDNRIENDRAMTLACALTENCSLRKLILAKNLIGSRGVNALAIVINLNKTLNVLDLQYNLATLNSKYNDSSANIIQIHPAIVLVNAFKSRADSLILNLQENDIDPVHFDQLRALCAHSPNFVIM